MINNNRTSRWSMLAVCGAAVIALAGACGGGSSEAGDGGDTGNTGESSSKPEINDPAVEAAALRPVDACALFNDTTIGELGTFEPHEDSALDE